MIGPTQATQQQNTDASKTITNVLRNFKTYYCLAGAIATVALLMFKTHPAVMMELFALAPFPCAVGVILRYFNQIQRLCAKLPLKGIVWSNGGVLFVCAVIARYRVSLALGMPAKDYSSTVCLLSAFLCIPAWIMVVMILLMAAMLVTFLLMLGNLVCHQGTSGIGGDIWKMCFPEDQRPKQIAKESEKRAILHLGDAAGIAALLVLSTSIFQFCHDRIVAPTSVRRLAYLVDYRPVKNYPGVDPSKRVVFHDRGLISYAVPVGNDIHIEPYQLPTPH